MSTHEPVNPDQPIERDPPGGPTLYFVVLGFLIVAVSIWALQGFTYAYRQSELEEKAPAQHNMSELSQLRDAQEKLLQSRTQGRIPIRQAMTQVIKDHRK